MWRSQAEAEGLTLRKADNKAGYFGVNHQSGRPKPYQAQVWRGGTMVHLGYFAMSDLRSAQREYRQTDRGVMSLCA